MGSCSVPSSIYIIREFRENVKFWVCRIKMGNGFTELKNYFVELNFQGPRICEQIINKILKPTPGCPVLRPEP
jgi:hypothetical protein